MINCAAKIGGQVFADKISIADNFYTRLKGLMGKRYLSKGQGLLLSPCNSIHTFGMKFDIDAIFLSEDNRVLYIYNCMGPKRISKFIKGSKYVLELNAGQALYNNISVGDRIDFVINKGSKCKKFENSEYISKFEILIGMKQTGLLNII